MKIKTKIRAGRTCTPRYDIPTDVWSAFGKQQYKGSTNEDQVQDPRRPRLRHPAPAVITPIAKGLAMKIKSKIRAGRNGCTPRVVVA